MLVFQFLRGISARKLKNKHKYQCNIIIWFTLLRSVGWDRGYIKTSILFQFTRISIYADFWKKSKSRKSRATCISFSKYLPSCLRLLLKNTSSHQKDISCSNILWFGEPWTGPRAHRRRVDGGVWISRLWLVGRREEGMLALRVYSSIKIAKSIFSNAMR